MRKLYKELTKDQKDRGVVFSSALSKYTVETSDDTVHEVLTKQDDRDKVIERLKNDKFFNSSPWKYNIIRS